jgi:hypothetical protein
VAPIYVVVNRPDGNVTISECMEGTLETLPAAPLNKADHHEYPVGSRHFAFKLKTEAWFIQRVHQQACNTERRASAAVDRAKNLASLIDRILFDRIFPGANEI